MASFNKPNKVEVHHKTGDIYITDMDHNMIRKMNEATGIITTVAGGGVGGFGEGGLATDARLNSPAGVTVTDSGEVYIADRMNHRIRKVDVNGIITTVAGTGTWGYDSEVGKATKVKINNPRDVGVLANGEIIFTDMHNQLIRKVSLDGQISTFTGNHTGGYNGDNIPARNATVSAPTDIHVLPNGNIFFLDQDSCRIRKIDRDGIITTVAGNGKSDWTVSGALATETSIHATVWALGVSLEEELCIGDYPNIVYYVNKAGRIS